MSRKHIGLSKHYIIIGEDDEGVKHFVGSFNSWNWVTAWFRTRYFAMHYRYRDRFVKIYHKSYF